MTRALQPLSYTILPLTSSQNTLTFPVISQNTLSFPLTLADQSQHPFRADDPQRVSNTLPWPDFNHDITIRFDGPPEPISPVVKVVLGVVVAVMIMLTIVGNALVCLAVVLVKKLRQPANYLIVSLAVADFMVGLLVMPLAMVDLLFPNWPLSWFWCKIWTTADLTLCTASIVSLCMISVDRYLVISSPLRYTALRTTTRILLYIGVVWVIAAVVGLSSHVISQLLDESVHEQTDSCEVIQHFAYQVYATIISFYGPTLIMLILYAKIWRAAKRLAAQDRVLGCTVEIDRNGNERSDLLLKEKEEEEDKKDKSVAARLVRAERYLHRPSALFHAVKTPLIRHHDKSECKARKTLGVIMSVFIICWLPFFFLAILKSCLSIQVSPWLDILTLWLGYSNSMLNPAIYCKYNKDFRIPFREILSCRCGTLQNVMRQQSFTSRYGPSVSRRVDSQAECSDV